MKLIEAKEYISDILSEARGSLAKIGVGAEQNLAEEISEGKGYIYGALVVGQDFVKDEDCLFFPIDVEVTGGEVSEEEIKASAEDFTTKIAELVKILSEAEDKEKAITLFGDEIQKSRELELMGQVKDLERDTSKNLRLALMAGGVMLVLAAICILISRLL